jgi:hypothetical protein
MDPVELLANAEHNLGSALKVRLWSFVEVAREQLQAAIKELDVDEND